MIAVCRSSTLRMTCAAFTRSVKIAAVPVLPAGRLSASFASSSFTRAMKGAASTALD
jgi:hypothetical protein